MKNGYSSFLVINTFGIGDVLFSTPLLRNLKNNFPRAKIFYMCNKKTAAILTHQPLIDKVFVYERDEFVAESKKSFWLGLKKYWDFIRDIRRERISAAVDLSLNTPFGFFAWAAGIKKRYGLDYKKRGLFLTHRLKIDGFLDKHVIEYYLDVLKLMGLTPQPGQMEVHAGSEAQGEASNILKSRGISESEFIVGIACCGGEAFGKDVYIRRWPEEKFSLLIDKLTADFKAKVFIFAGPKEKKEVAQILSRLNNKQGVYEFSDSSLAVTAALVEKCRLFIGNDTGPLKFADALNKKIVAFYGPVDEKVYGPYPADAKRCIVLKKDFPCRPCYQRFRLKPCEYNRRCLTEISVDEVIAAIKKLIV